MYRGCVIRYISVFVTKLCLVVVAKFTKFKKFSKFYPLPRNIISLEIYAKTFLHNHATKEKHNVRFINSLVFKNMDKLTLFNDHLRIKVDGL